jgi:hypothetical protein
MSGWIACAIVYGLGCIEVWMVRRDVPTEFKYRVLGTALWPLGVPLALIERRGLYAPRESKVS